MKFDILKRRTGAVQFTAEIECAEDTPRNIKVGLAVQWALRSGADLRHADLRGADLRGADLRHADLSDAVLSGADLRDADLRHADLSDAVLSGADLRDADLRHADLSGAVLSDADLSAAVLSRARAIFAGVDARGYEFYFTAGAKPDDIVIRAGCRRWVSFTDARAHFTQNYTSNGNVPEILAKLNLLETVATARGYVTAGA